MTLPEFRETGPNLPMKYETKINPSQLAAMLPFCSQDETRYALNGVHLDLSPTQAFAVATDGRRLCRFDLDVSRPDEPIVFTIPSHLVKLVGDEREAILTYDSETQEVEFRCELYTLAGKAIEVEYPNWRIVVPDPIPPDFNPRPLMLNGMFFADALAVIETLTRTKGGVKITCSEEPPICFEGVGVLVIQMPLTNL